MGKTSTTIKMICLVDNHFGNFTINKIYNGVQYINSKDKLVSTLIDNNGYFIKISLDNKTFINLRDKRNDIINKILNKKCK